MLSSDQIQPETDFAKNLFSEPEFGVNPITSTDFFTPRATPWISHFHFAIHKQWTKLFGLANFSSKFQEKFCFLFVLNLFSTG